MTRTEIDFKTFGNSRGGVKNFKVWVPFPKLFVLKFRNCTFDLFYVLFFRSRRPEARPSTSLVLQLMDFEEKLQFKVDKTKQKRLSGARGILTSFYHLDWKGKIKLAIPLSIYLMITALVVKIIYEVVFGQDSRSIFPKQMRQHETSDDDLVCF